MFSAMVDTPISVLLVEDTSAEAGLIQSGLANANDDSVFHVECVTRLDAALERLGRPGIDVVMLDHASRWQGN
jgi:DNA-binding response OmpR family regulator